MFWSSMRVIGSFASLFPLRFRLAKVVASMFPLRFRLTKSVASMFPLRFGLAKSVASMFPLRFGFAKDCFPIILSVFVAPKGDFCFFVSQEYLGKARSHPNAKHVRASKL